MYQNPNNPFAPMMKDGSTTQIPQIQGIQAPASPQVNTQPGIGEQMGNMAMQRGMSKGLDYAEAEGGNMLSNMGTSIGNAAGNVGTASE